MNYVIKRERSTHTLPQRAGKGCAKRQHTDVKRVVPTVR